MTLLKFDPVRGFEKMSRRMNEFANELNRGISFETGGFNPRVDITEDAKNIYLAAELAGMTKEDIKVSINDDNILILKGEKKAEEAKEGKSFLRTERFYGSFSRSFILPENLNKDEVSAKFEDGLLELTIPKLEPPQPKEVEIKIS